MPAFALEFLVYLFSVYGVVPLRTAPSLLRRLNEIVEQAVALSDGGNVGQ